MVRKGYSKDLETWGGLWVQEDGYCMTVPAGDIWMSCDLSDCHFSCCWVSCDRVRQMNLFCGERFQNQVDERGGHCLCCGLNYRNSFVCYLSLSICLHLSVHLSHLNMLACLGNTFCINFTHLFTCMFMLLLHVSFFCWGAY